jgi:hypothetical protein
MGDRYSATKVSDSCWDAGLRKVDSVQLRERITGNPEVIHLDMWRPTHRPEDGSGHWP